MSQKKLNIGIKLDDIVAADGSQESSVRPENSLLSPMSKISGKRISYQAGELLSKPTLGSKSGRLARRASVSMLSLAAFGVSSPTKAPTPALTKKEKFRQMAKKSVVFTRRRKSFLLGKSSHVQSSKGSQISLLKNFGPVIERKEKKEPKKDPRLIELEQMKSKRASLPPTGEANIDKIELKYQLAKASQEMDQCIDDGSIPAFGYPLVCYSPVGQKTRIQGEFWQIFYQQAMKATGKPNIIGLLLDRHDDFQQSNEELLRDFTKGRYVRTKFLEQKNVKIDTKGISKAVLKNSENERQKRRRRAETNQIEQKPQENQQKKEQKNILGYNSTLDHLIRIMKKEQRDMHREISEENKRLKNKLKLNQEPTFGQTTIQGTDIRSSSPSPMTKRSPTRGEKVINLGDFCEKKYNLAYLGQKKESAGTLFPPQFDQMTPHRKYSHVVELLKKQNFQLPLRNVQELMASIGGSTGTFGGDKLSQGRGPPQQRKSNNSLLLFPSPKDMKYRRASAAPVTQQFRVNSKDKSKNAYGRPSKRNIEIGFDRGDSTFSEEKNRRMSKNYHRPSVSRQQPGKLLGSTLFDEQATPKKSTPSKGSKSPRANISLSPQQQRGAPIQQHDTLHSRSMETAALLKHVPKQHNPSPKLVDQINHSTSTISSAHKKKMKKFDNPRSSAQNSLTFNSQVGLNENTSSSKHQDGALPLIKKPTLEEQQVRSDQQSMKSPSRPRLHHNYYSNIGSSQDPFQSKEPASAPRKKVWSNSLEPIGASKSEKKLSAMGQNLQFRRFIKDTLEVRSGQTPYNIADPRHFESMSGRVVHSKSKLSSGLSPIHDNEIKNSFAHLPKNYFLKRHQRILEEAKKIKISITGNPQTSLTKALVRHHKKAVARTAKERSASKPPLIPPPKKIEILDEAELNQSNISSIEQNGGDKTTLKQDSEHLLSSQLEIGQDFNLPKRKRRRRRHKGRSLHSTIENLVESHKVYQPHIYNDAASVTSMIKASKSKSGLQAAKPMVGNRSQSSLQKQQSENPKVLMKLKGQTKVIGAQTSTGFSPVNSMKSKKGMTGIIFNSQREVPPILINTSNLGSSVQFGQATPPSQRNQKTTIAQYKSLQNPLNVKTQDLTSMRAKQSTPQKKGQVSKKSANRSRISLGNDPSLMGGTTNISSQISNQYQQL